MHAQILKIRFQFSSQDIMGKKKYVTLRPCKAQIIVLRMYLASIHDATIFLKNCSKSQPWANKWGNFQICIYETHSGNNILTFSWSKCRRSLISRSVRLASMWLSKASAIFLIATISLVSVFNSELQIKSINTTVNASDNLLRKEPEPIQFKLQ